MWIKTYDQKRDPGMILGPLGASKRSSNAQKVYTHVGGEFRQYGKSGPIGYSTGTRTDAWPVSVARPTWLRRYGHCLSGIRYGIGERRRPEGSTKRRVRRSYRSHPFSQRGADS